MLEVSVSGSKTKKAVALEESVSGSKTKNAIDKKIHIEKVKGK